MRKPPPGNRPVTLGSMALAVLLSAAAAASAAEPPWVGRWAASTHWCDPNYQGGAAPIDISPAGHENAGHECVYTAIEKEDDAPVWRLEADCIGPANIPYRERFVFEMLGDTLRITYPDRGGAEVLQMRCP